MNTLSASPDITLHLDLAGVILDARLANEFATEPVAAWIGMPWDTTVDAAARDDLTRLLTTVRTTGTVAAGEVQQRFPSGLAAAVEYTAVPLGLDRGLILVGRQARAVAELEGRLLEAQQTMERDYWKRRAVETRYRMLFETANDALITLSRERPRILDLNPPAAELLGVAADKRAAARGMDLRDWLPAAARTELDQLLRRVAERGSAPAVLLALGDGRPAVMVRAALVGGGADALLTLQLTQAATATNTQPADQSPMGASTGAKARSELDRAQLRLLARSPDGQVLIDHTGRILRANAAFVEMAEAGSEATLLGESFGRWLGRPGADLTLLLANLERFGTLRLFATHIRGTLGSEVEVEISANGDCEQSPALINLVVRDVGRRLTPRALEPTVAGGLETLSATFASRLGKTPLRELVEETVAEVEKHYLTAALELTGGNRSAAAQLLGVSRQSLYGKLTRLDLAGLPLNGGPRG